MIFHYTNSIDIRTINALEVNSTDLETLSEVGESSHNGTYAIFSNTTCKPDIRT